MCLEVGNGLSGWFQFRVARVFGLRMLAGATVSEDLTGAGGSLPRWLTHVAVGRRHQFFTICATPLCCLNVPIWQLAPPERVLRQRERQGERGLKSEREGERWRDTEIVLEITYHHVFHILIVTSESLSLTHSQWE